MKRFVTTESGVYELDLNLHPAELKRGGVYQLWASDGRPHTENFLGNTTLFEGKTASAIVDDVFDYCREILDDITEDENFDGWIAYAFDPKTHKNLVEVKMTFSD